MGFALSILFVIFGGGYYLIRYLIESGQDESFRRNAKRDEERKKEFKELVCDEGVENEIRINLYDDHKWAWKEIEKAVKKEQWYQYLDKNDYDLEMLMIRACKGIMSQSDVVFGISCNTIKPLRSARYIDGRKARGLCMLWIADKIKQERGVEINVIVRSFDGRYRYLTEEHLYDDNDSTYVWDQIMPCNVNRLQIKGTYTNPNEK